VTSCPAGEVLLTPTLGFPELLEPGTKSDLKGYRVRRFHGNA
jgi:hypothetical protein